MDFTDDASRPWLLKYGDVVKWLDARNTKMIKLKPGKRIQSSHGYIRHEQIAGVMPGSAVYDHRGKEFRKPFRASAEDWTTNLSHRTQIVYAPDLAAVVCALRLKPGHVVLESGTGSASATHTFARAVAPTGRVYTFEFNALRAEAARRELACTGLGYQQATGKVISQAKRPPITITALASASVNGQPEGSTGSSTAPSSEEASKAAGRFDPEAPFGVDSVGPCFATGGPVVVSAHGDALQGFPTNLSEPSPQVDAVFLDLPAPWSAIPHAAAVTRHGGRICCFSPCMEQVQRNCAALLHAGFVDIETIEVLGVDYVVESKMPPPAMVKVRGGAPAGRAGDQEAGAGAGSMEGSDSCGRAVAEAPPGFVDPLRVAGGRAVYGLGAGADLAPRSLFPKASQPGHTAYLTFGTRHRDDVVREAMEASRRMMAMSAGDGAEAANGSQAGAGGKRGRSEKENGDDMTGDGSEGGGGSKKPRHDEDGEGEGEGGQGVEDGEQVKGADGAGR